jgi:hypothetical protein
MKVVVKKNLKKTLPSYAASNSSFPVYVAAFYDLQALDAFPKSTYAARVVHEDRDTIRLRLAHRHVFCLVRNLVGKNHHGIGVFDLASHTLLRLAENPQVHPQAFGFLAILSTQAVHAAYQYDAHEYTTFWE